MTDDSRAIVKSFYDEIQNSQNLQALDKFYQDKVKWHGLENSPMFPDSIDSIEDLRGFLEAYFKAVHSQVEIVESIVEENKVAVRLKVKAVHSGNLFGCEATGQNAECDGSAVFTLKDGKIHEEWNFLDIGAMALQFGFELRLPDGSPRDYEALKKIHPQLTTFDRWLKNTGWRGESSQLQKNPLTGSKK